MSSRLCGRTVAVLYLALPAAAAAQVPDVSGLPPYERYALRVEYRDYRPKLTGEFQKGTAEQSGTLIDVLDDLGLEDERTFEVRGGLQVKPGHKIRGSYTRLRYDGDLEARRNFTFDDTRYDRFARVRTTLRGAYYSAAYEWDLFKGRVGYLGLLLGAKAVDIDYVVVAPELDRRETDTLLTPFPSLGAAGRVYTGRLSLEGELSGFTLGKKGSLFEAETSIRVHLSDRLAVQGGYRRLSLRAEEGTDNANFRLGGFNFGLELSL